MTINQAEMIGKVLMFLGASEDDIMKFYDTYGVGLDYDDFKETFNLAQKMEFWKRMQLLFSGEDEIAEFLVGRANELSKKKEETK